jgi:hypothetical protein
MFLVSQKAPLFRNCEGSKFHRKTSDFSKLGFFDKLSIKTTGNTFIIQNKQLSVETEVTRVKNFTFPWGMST